MPGSDREIYISAIIIGIFFLLLISIIVIAGYLYNKRRKMQAKERIVFQQTLLQTQLEIQEQTLKNISQEIHDNIGQALSLAKLNLNTMPGTNDEQLQQKISNSKELVSKAIVDLRDLSRSLNTDYVADMGLQRAIEYELELINKSAAIKTKMHVDGFPFRFDKQKELILFRIVQEVLNNIIKHAAATQIQVVLNYKPAGLEMQLSDNGKGFDNAADNGGPSFGLGHRNMHNRAKLIGASFAIRSSLGKGTEINIILPKEKENNEN